MKWKYYRNFVKLFDEQYFVDYTFERRKREQEPLISLILRLKNIKEKSVLEIGAAKGFMCKVLNNSGYKTIGIDVSEYVCKLSEGRVFRASLTHLPFKDKTFEIVICADVLEHIPYKILRNHIGEIFRVSKRYVIVTLPFLHNIKDRTHVTLLDKEQWIKLLAPFGKIMKITLPAYEIVFVIKL